MAAKDGTPKDMEKEKVKVEVKAKDQEKEVGDSDPRATGNQEKDAAKQTACLD